MVLSMTGYGMGVAEDKTRVTVEIKTVNHRYLDLFLRLPRGYMSLEDVVRQEISDRLSRGRVEVVVTIEDFTTADRTVKIDWGLVKGYEAALMELERTLGVHYQARGEHILQQPDVLVAEQTSTEDVEPVLRTAISQALDNLITMREREGANLSQDLQQRIEKLQEMASLLKEKAPEIVTAYQTRLQDRISELMGQVPVDPDRVALEVAIFADKTNVTEELVRLESHLTQFQSILEQSGPIGRKLDFLTQEIQRELNTTASKANDSTVSQLVVDGKAELEKIREQVQNIE